MKFGDFLRQNREARGWTQPEASTRAGIEQSYLSKLETGKSYPSEDVYTRLVAAYEIDADDLVRQISSAELSKLREISEVRTAVLDLQKGQQTFARGWMIAGLICLAGRGASFGAALLARDDVQVLRHYRSTGVLTPGEALEAFDIVDRQLSPIQSDYDQLVAQRNTMIERMDEKEIVTAEDRGHSFLEKQNEGLRKYDMNSFEKRTLYSPLRLFLVPALALLAAALGCGFITIRWK